MSGPNRYEQAAGASNKGERLIELFWLSVMRDANCCDLPEITSSRRLQLRKLVRSWRERDAIDELIAGVNSGRQSADVQTDPKQLAE